MVSGWLTIIRQVMAKHDGQVPSVIRSCFTADVTIIKTAVTALSYWSETSDSKQQKQATEACIVTFVRTCRHVAQEAVESGSFKDAVAQQADLVQVESSPGSVDKLDQLSWQFGLRIFQLHKDP